MTSVREIILDHGGSVEGVPNRAMFWLPDELVKSDGFKAFHATLSARGSKIKPTETIKSGWQLWRFVGDRKPGKLIRVNDRSATNNIDPRLSITVFRDGRVVIRESKRRVAFDTTVAAIYRRCLINEAFRAGAARARKKKADKAAKRRR